MLLVITGNGKGKTTSAIGTAIRGLGWGKKVALIHFDKGGSHYGEHHVLEKLQDLDVFRFGKKRFDEAAKKFRFENTDEDKREAELAIQKIHNLYHKEYFLIIADELINCLNLGLADESSVRELINKCPKETHLILTGRNAPEWMIEKADLVSEIQETKHYFKSGKQDIKGLDY
ncbi:cob(I)yrinic acid a,c-diamide adenosyltransferase [Patescibacteria group bacterium]|nr:cob(I)yrinic acid a,c-diamide adenosyltransferase [Patescibacteria group bacterium]